MKKKRILFISNELTVTGAPLVLLRLCRLAAAKGFRADVWSMTDGPLRTELEAEGFAVKIVPIEATGQHFMALPLRRYGLAVCSTVITADFAALCARHIPTAWIFHEAANVADILPGASEKFRRIVRHFPEIYCVSEYAAAELEKYTDAEIRLLPNFVEDRPVIPNVCTPAEPLRFLQLGTVEPRKGSDVLLEAFSLLSAEERAGAELFFAGACPDNEFTREFKNKLAALPQARLLGELREEGKKLQTLAAADVIAVASRDEACSLVALEGAMLAKPLLVTENVGAKYLVDRKNGWVVETANAGALSMALRDALSHRAELTEMGRVSRERYEKLASPAACEGKAAEIFALAGTEKTEAFQIKKKRWKEIYAAQIVQR